MTLNDVRPVLSNNIQQFTGGRNSLSTVLWRRSQFRQFPSFAGMASCSARCAAVSLRLARKLRISRGSVPVPPRTGFLRDCLSPPPEQLRRFLPKSPDRRSPWQSCSHSATSAKLANPAVDERSEVGLPIGVFLHLVLLGFEKNCRQLMYPLGRGGLGYLFQQGVSIDRLSGQAVVGEVATERSQNGAKIFIVICPCWLSLRLANPAI